jgi:hypothetical protein
MHRSKKRLFDHLFGKCQQRRRYCEIKRLGGLEIDHQVEFCRLLYGQIGWLRAPENLVNVKRRMLKELSEALAFRIRPCPLYPRKRTCAVQLGMSALGQ